MNRDVLAFIAELARLNIVVDYKTGSHLFAWVEQKARNQMVREGRRTGQCECCGGEMR